MSHEREGATDEWYTPEYIFTAMNVTFDLDVAPAHHLTAPAHRYCRYGCLDGMVEPWTDFVWMNAPFGKRNGLIPWLAKFIDHADGVALTPDRPGAPWWQHIAKHSALILVLAPKVRFIEQFGNEGKSPSNGTTLFAIGGKGREALEAAACLGVLLAQPQESDSETGGN